MTPARTPLAAPFSARPARSFTMVEMLIAVAAVAIISIGLAKLFAATGQTVRIGRRVSALNEVAARLERTLRDDIAHMSRKGLLVIVNARVVSNDPVLGVPPGKPGVQLSATQPVDSVRPRRVDQLMFFEEGNFTSLREPLHPSRIASGPAARIWWGHGQRQKRDYTQSRSIDVDISDVFAGNNASPARPTFGAIDTLNYPKLAGVNQYASGWILMRHVTVLAPLQATASPNRPTGFVPATSDSNYLADGVWRDSVYQIALQPAVPDIFRAIASNFGHPFPLPSSTGASLVRADASPVPAFGCGAVDIAATDLAAIRARVLSDQDMTQIGSVIPFMTQSSPSSPQDGAVGLAMRPSSAGASPTLEMTFDADTSPPIAPTSPTTGSAYRMKQWMISALPAGPAPGDELKTVSQVPEFRMCCEQDPPDPMGFIVKGNNPVTPFLDTEAYRRTDQLMLSASNFAVGCTEFIVEWSFGKVFPDGTNDNNTPPNSIAGNLIWHGLARTEDVNGDGVTNSNEYAAVPYGFAGIAFPSIRAAPAGHAPLDWLESSVALNDGTMSTAVSPDAFWAVAPELVSMPVLQRSGAPWNTLDRLYSCFGYVDPSFSKTAAQAYSAQASTAWNSIPLTNAPVTIPWAWPKLLRITVRLADPSEPNQEYTYQFVLQVPQGDAN